MPTFDSLDKLMAHIQKQVTESLKTDVAYESAKLMQDHVEADVYQAYSPQDYERTGELFSEVETEMIDDNTLEIKDTRTDGNKYIVPIIEYGQGYSWGAPGELDRRIGARPFVANTREELANGKAREFMKEALEKRFGKGAVI